MLLIGVREEHRKASQRKYPSCIDL